MFGTIGFYLAAGGLTVLTIGWTMLIKARAFYMYSEITTGKIVGTEFIDINRRNCGYAPIIEFTLDNKNKKKRKDDFTRIRFTGSNLARKESSFEIGAAVPVRYIPQKPEFARINSFNEIWLEPLAGMLAGLIFTSVGLFFLSASR